MSISDLSDAKVDSLAFAEEVNFLIGHIPTEKLQKAVVEANVKGVEVDQYLVHQGLISERFYFQKLADETGCALLPTGWDSFDQSYLMRSLYEGDVPQAILPLRPEVRPYTHVASPKGAEVRTLLRACRQRPEIASRIALAPPSMLANRLQIILHEALHARAANHLMHTKPHLSAAMPLTALQITWLACFFGAFFLTAFIDFRLFAALLTSIFTIIFAGHILLKGLAALPLRRAAAKPEKLQNSELPSYSVLVPLYKEDKKVIAQLREALLALDYPEEKLEIKIIVEADDLQTIGTIDSFKWPRHFAFILVPPGHPRTKPKAMNLALPFVKTPFLTIFDAEDVPHKGQLRIAAERFVRKEGVACLQARLSFYNAHDNWLTRQFAIEYACLFDRILPTFERLKLPLPLGGTSNHFRVKALREAGGWDPHNVTEDADLGVRLKALGYETSILDSETCEEATSRYLAWHGQRTRWQKGWLQTWLVNMRSPLSLMRNIGIRPFLGFQLYVGGLIIAPLAHLVLVCSLVMSLLLTGETSYQLLNNWQFVVLILGYLTSFTLAFVACIRRDLRLIFSIPFMPIYWLLISLSAIHAFVDLARRPYYWAKTPHGLSLQRKFR